MSFPLRTLLPALLVLFCIACGSGETGRTDATPEAPRDTIALDFPDTESVWKRDDLQLRWKASEKQAETEWVITISEQNGDTKTEVLKLRVDVPFYRPQNLDDNKMFVWKVEVLDNQGQALVASEERTFYTYATRMLQFSGGLDQSSSPREFTRFGDDVYFTAYSPSDGHQVWRWSVSGGLLECVTKIVAGVGSASPGDFTVCNGKLYFTAFTESGGRELWRLDSSAPEEVGATLVWDFTQEASENDTTGDESENILKESGDPTELFAIGSALYVSASRRQSCNGCPGEEKTLWRIVEEGGPPTVIEIPLVDENEDVKGTLPQAMTTFDGDLYLTAVTEKIGRLLWRVSDIAGDPITSLVKAGSEPVMEPIEMEVTEEANSVLYFSGRTEAHGAELWKVVLGSDVPALVKEIVAGSGSSWPADLTASGDTLYFTAKTPDSGHELWVSDGTEEGTRMLPEIVEGSRGGQPRKLTVSGGNLFFVAFTPDKGLELWKSDGTTVSLVKDILEGEASSNLSELTPFNGGVLFRVGDGFHGVELWESMGEVNNTLMVKDIQIGSRGSLPKDLLAYGNRVLFSAHDGFHGRELWESNGTENGTRMVENINAYVDPGIHSVVSIGARVSMVATTAKDGTELFSIENNSGVSLIADIQTGYAGSDPKDLFVHNGKAYFSALANQDDTKRDLWTTDGTRQGTAMVRKLQAEPGPLAFTSFGGKLYFVVKGGSGSGAPSWKVWESDGKSTGTNPLSEFFGKSLPSDEDSQAMAATTEALFVAGTDGLLMMKEGEKPVAVIGSYLKPKHLFPVGKELLFSSQESLENPDQRLSYRKDDGILEYDDELVDPEGFYRTGDFVYFKANGVLYRFDVNAESLAEGVIRIMGAFANGSTELSEPTSFCGTDGALWCIASAGTKAIWHVTGGATTATRLIDEVTFKESIDPEDPKEVDATPGELRVLGDALYYSATMAGKTHLFMAKDGEAGRVGYHVDSDTHVALEQVGSLTVIKEKLYFVANNPALEDGTPVMWVTSPPIL